MKTMMTRAPLLALALLALAAPAVHAQYNQNEPEDQSSARPRLLLALQDDLQSLDDSLAALPRRHPRAAEFQRRADDIRSDVQALAERLGASDRLGRSGRAEVATLRDTVAVLRGDVDEAVSNGRWRRSGLFVVPPGTEIEVALEQPLSSRSSNPEDRIFATTVSALRVNGRTVIPAGATVHGSVREVRSRNRGQQDGWLRLDFDQIAPEGGPEVEMRSHVVAVPDAPLNQKSLRNGGLGALLGGVVGGIIDGRKGALIGAAVGAGGGLLASQGNDIDLPEGTLILLRLDAPLTIARR
jgi:hypothetical protein